MCIHIIKVESHVLLPNNHGCHVLRVGALANDTPIENLPWHLFQRILTSLITAFLEENAILHVFETVVF